MIIIVNKYVKFKSITAFGDSYYDLPLELCSVTVIPHEELIWTHTSMNCYCSEFEDWLENK